MAASQIIEISSSDEDDDELVFAALLALQRPSKAKLAEWDFKDVDDDEPEGSLYAPHGNATVVLPAAKSVPTTIANEIQPDIDDFGFPPSRKRKHSDIPDYDNPLDFTASPRLLPREADEEKRHAEGDQDLEDELDDILLSRSSAFGSKLSSRTTALLTEIDINKNRARKSNARSAKVSKKEGKMLEKTLDDSESVSRTQSLALSLVLSEPTKRARAARKPRLTKAEREVKERERDLMEHERLQVRKQKEREKEEDKARKEFAKKEKEIEKQKAAVLAEINKSKADKKSSTPEMIVDLPASIEGQSLDIQVREFLTILGVEVTTKPTPVPNVIRWRRKSKSRFNDELGHWEPIPETIMSEKHIMCLVSAKELVSLAASKATGQDDVGGHVRKLKSAFPGCIPIYLIEGLDTLLRKAKNSKNRSYQAAVQRQMNNAGESSTASKSKQKQPEEDIVDENQVEDALLDLQVVEGCLVHQTAASIETAEWIQSFTAHISTIPYK